MTEKLERAIIVTEATGVEENYNGLPVVENFKKAKNIMIINQGLCLEDRLVEQGFKWLGRWEVIVPLRPYEELLMDFVKDKTIAEIQELKLGDLRSPVFDTRLMFVKPGTKVNKLWKLYQERLKDWDPKVAFVAAVWETLPYIKPLPPGEWIK